MASDLACLRLSGTADGASFWRALRDLELPFFAGEAPLWRVALPPATPAQARIERRLKAELDPDGVFGGERAAS